MESVYSTETLTDSAKTGSTKYWTGDVVTDGTNHYLQATYWTVNKNGTKGTVQKSEPRLVTPKNVGKSNETSPLEQAISELDSLFLRQKDKGYSEEGEDTSGRLTLPMLAQSFADKSHNVKWPCAIQPKYNGVRAPSDGTQFWSRKAKIYGDDVTFHLQFDCPDIILDGEMILPFAHDESERFTFQETISAVKKYRKELSPKLRYYVYDVVSTTLPFSTRIQIAEDAIRLIDNPQIILAPTFIVNSVAEAVEKHLEFVAQGFEGSILRNLDGMYLPGKRSSDLLKMKDFIDGEFEIVGFEDGLGKEVGAIIFTCVTPEGITFNVRPEGAMQSRRDMYAKGNKYIGKMYTVRYQCLTDELIPFFPVGVEVRDYE